MKIDSVQITSVRKVGLTTGADPGFFSGGGAPLTNGVTDG